MLATEHRVWTGFDDGKAAPDLGPGLGWYALCTCRWFAAHQEDQAAATAAGKRHVDACS